MFGIHKIRSTAAGLLVGAASLLAVTGGASAAALPIETVGFLPNDTLLQRVDLGAAGLTTINTIVLTDISNGSGGSEGMFSGYDLDAVFLDRDGSLATSDDRYYFTSLNFVGGTLRFTVDPEELPPSPNANDYGPYFGTNEAGVVGPFGSGSQAPTLNEFDADNIAERSNGDGFLSLGDGGVLTLTFANIAVEGGLWLMFGEGAGQGEALMVEAPGQVPLPGAVWLFLSAIAVLFGMSRRRSAATA